MTDSLSAPTIDDILHPADAHAERLRQIDARLARIDLELCRINGIRLLSLDRGEEDGQ